ncbi:pilus biosynthesis protein [Psychromonas marina]|uniref:Pilus biosynthesis protein n=1 Tax=Psychromonas marina TaxID=88364 RepID=A0ABQ6DWM4_9GAMM|nr:type IV pilin protein [Psychromonas marina]GLS89541.1 pilus biosynthesis protein [Psychromonas marina]
MNIQHKKNNIAGFTLIELLISIAIIGILSAVAYPSYTSVMEKARREEAKRTLLEASQIMESYYAMNLNYSNAVSASAVTIFTTNADFDEYYNLTGVTAATSFTLTATPIASGAQSGDDCGTLTITNTGITSASTTGCW